MVSGPGCARSSGWMRNADLRMSRTFSVPRLNETTTKPSSTSLRSSTQASSRACRGSRGSARIGGASGVTSPKSAPRLMRLPRTRWSKYDSPSAPPATSWPIELRRPSQRRGASSAHRTSQDASRLPSVTSFTIVREAVGDEAAALLRVRVARGRGGRVFNYSPLPAGAHDPEAGDHEGGPTIDQGELVGRGVAPAERARIARRDETRRRAGSPGDPAGTSLGPGMCVGDSTASARGESPAGTGSDGIAGGSPSEASVGMPTVAVSAGARVVPSRRFGAAGAAAIGAVGAVGAATGAVGAVGADVGTAGVASCAAASGATASPAGVAAAGAAGAAALASSGSIWASAAIDP